MMRKALTPQTPDQQVLPPPLPRREKIPRHEHPLTHTHTRESQLRRTQTSRHIARILTHTIELCHSLWLSEGRTAREERKTKHTGWMEGGHVLYSADRIKQAVCINYTLVPQVQDVCAYTSSRSWVPRGSGRGGGISKWTPGGAWGLFAYDSGKRPGLPNILREKFAKFGENMPPCALRKLVSKEKWQLFYKNQGYFLEQNVASQTKQIHVQLF